MNEIIKKLKRNNLQLKEVVGIAWLIFLIFLILMFGPFLTRKLLQLTFDWPFSVQRQAVREGNKTQDTASGVEGTFVNNIPLNLFESMTNVSSKSFKKVEIQIPKIYVSSPMFDMSTYGKELQDIWIGSFNTKELKEEYKNFAIYYNNNKVNDNGKEYTSQAVPDNDIDTMQAKIKTELETGSYNVKFKKWFVPDGGVDPTEAIYIKGDIKFQSTIEIEDWKPNIFWGPTLRNVEATFVDSDNGLELKGKVRVKE